MKKIVASILLVGALWTATFGTAFAESPWMDNGKFFHPTSQPCQNQNDHPKCPGAN